MSSAKQQAAINKFMHVLNEWDKGATSVRKKILTDFIKQHENKTGSDIEEEMANAASLFFARLTAWLRLT